MDTQPTSTAPATDWQLAEEALARTHALFTTFNDLPWTPSDSFRTFDSDTYLQDLGISLWHMISSTSSSRSPLEQAQLLSRFAARFNSDTDSGSEWEEDEYFYSYPPSEAPSEDDVPEGRECDICGSRRTTVQFRGCSHGACVPCTKGMWGGRKRDEEHFPGWFPCHMCRREVREVGMLEEGLRRWWDRRGATVERGEIYRWVGVKRWMAERSERVREGMGWKGAFL